MKSLSASEVQAHVDRLSKLANRAKYSEVYKTAKSLMLKHPDIYQFAHMEAVFYAEDDHSYSPAEVARRYRVTAGKLRKLLKRMNGLDARLRVRTRNEYFWFSKQPAKQYRLGVEAVSKGMKRSYYSMGVGAAEMARVYATAGKAGLCLRWAKKSEAAWLKFFKQDSEWFNSYFFYATALGLQFRDDEMEAALLKSRKIARKPASWEALAKIRRDVFKARSGLKRPS